MKKMQLLQPKITELKEKYKDDQQKVQKETMKLYQTYGVNPGWWMFTNSFADANFYRIVGAVPGSD